MRLDQHLRTIQLGPNKILVCAEADASDATTGKQVEVKTKDPLAEKCYDKDKSKLLFQMISNGSETLVTLDRTKDEDRSQLNLGGKDTNQNPTFTVNSVKRIPISNIVESLSEGKDMLDRKIATAASNLQIIQQKIKEGDDTCYELNFDKDELILRPFVSDYVEKTGSIKSQPVLCKNIQDEFQKINSDYYRDKMMVNSPIRQNSNISHTKEELDPNDGCIAIESARATELFKIERGNYQAIKSSSSVQNHCGIPFILYF